MVYHLHKKAYEHIKQWRCRPLSGSYPYVYVDGIYLKRNWGGEIRNDSILVAIGVSSDGYREIIGAGKGMKEDKESWRSFFVWLKERGLAGVRLIIGDKNFGMLETIPEVFPDAREKAQRVADKLKEMKLGTAAKKLQEGIEETLTYMDFPTQHWSRIRTNNTMERLNREIKRRTKVIGAFPDGQSALMLVCARLRHVAGTQQSSRRYMNMEHLSKPEDELLPDIIAS